MAWLWLAGLASAAEFTTEARPAAVTVFAQQARVTREASLDLPAGRHEVRFLGLPADTDSASLTAELAGVGEIVGVDARWRPASTVADARVAELSARRLALSDDRLALSNDISAWDAELSALSRSYTEAGKALSAQLLVGDKAAERSKALRVSLAAEEGRVRDLRRAALEQRAELDRRIGALDRELQQLGSEATDVLDAVVHVEVARPGRVTTRLQYMVGGATWAPRYDLRGDGAGSVSLALSALVSQTTGEDWTGVKLAVSSARPDRGTVVPRLDPYWLQVWMPPPPPMAMAAPAPAARAAKSMAMADEAVMAEPVMAPMEVARAEVDVGLAATTFQVQRVEDVPSDGSRRKVLLTTEQLDADLRHVVVPRLEARAWIVGEVKNTAPFPLLAGEAGVFLDGAYIGDTWLDTVAPGAKFDVAFGADDRVAVKRRPRAVEVGASAGPKREKARWEWEVSVQNGRKVPLKIELREQVPLSDRAEVTVKRLADAQGAPVPEEQPEGLLVWRYEVPAGANRAVVWGYTVEYPAGQAMGWME